MDMFGHGPTLCRRRFGRRSEARRGLAEALQASSKRAGRNGRLTIAPRPLLGRTPRWYLSPESWCTLTCRWDPALEFPGPQRTAARAPRGLGPTSTPAAPREIQHLILPGKELHWMTLSIWILARARPRRGSLSNSACSRRDARDSSQTRGCRVPVLALPPVCPARGDCGPGLRPAGADPGVLALPYCDPARGDCDLQLIAECAGPGVLGSNSWRIWRRA